MRQTKIVATISDLRCDIGFLQTLYDAGMNVARINTAHISAESGKILINNIRAVSDKIAILIDTKGPEIRTCAEQKELNVQGGQDVIFSFKPIVSEMGNICVNYKNFVFDLNIGNKILIDDGDVALTVTEKHKEQK